MTGPPASTPAPTCRWIPPLTLPGWQQMAIDVWLLERALAGAGPALRLYHWQRPTLSLGQHQRTIPSHWLTPPPTALAPHGLDLVRRPSGGRAVLHAGSLTYALVWPAAPAQRVRAYGQACAWLQQAFAGLGLPLQGGVQAPSRDRASCFATATAADLVHADGSKRIGSAQLWRRGCLLQHGSVLIAPQPDLWHWLFQEAAPALPALPVAGGELEERLRRAAAEHLPCAAGGLASRPLSASELAEALALGPRYRLAAPGEPAGAAASSPGTSPELSIRRAT